jgi:hypothetical protein
LFDLVFETRSPDVAQADLKLKSSYFSQGAQVLEL